MSSKKTGETQRDEHLESYNLKGVLPFGLDGSTARSILVDSSGRIITSEANILSVTNAIDQVAYNLNAAAFSETTNISNDYILDSIELNFSTAEAKTITITSSDGTILWGGSVDTSASNLGYNTTAQNFNLIFNQAFNGGENITVAVTQFGSAGTMDCVLKVKQGSLALSGNPVLGAGSNTIGKVDQGAGGTDPWPIITTVHQKVHEGRFFSGGYYNAAVGDGSSIDVLIQSHATEATHIDVVLATTGDSVFRMYTGTTFSAAGTSVTMSNHNLGSANTFQGTVTHTPTVTGTGTQIDGTSLIPGGTKSAGSGGIASGFQQEFILAPGTNYLLRFTNNSGVAQKMEISLRAYHPNL